jgi:hypothetical protein
MISAVNENSLPRRETKRFVASCRGVDGFAWQREERWYFQAQNEEKAYPCKKDDLVIMQLIS